MAGAGVHESSVSGLHLWVWICGVQGSGGVASQQRSTSQSLPGPVPYPPHLLMLPTDQNMMCLMTFRIQKPCLLELPSMQLYYNNRGANLSPFGEIRRFHLEIGHSRESCRSVKKIKLRRGGGVSLSPFSLLMSLHPCNKTTPMNWDPQ